MVACDLRDDPACRAPTTVVSRDNGDMTMATSPVLITLTDQDRAKLEALARARKAPLRAVQRAWIVLAAADGQPNAQIADCLGLHVDTVRTWRGRFAARGLKGLTDRARSGRPPVFAATVRAEVKALACWLPAEHGLPLSRLSSSVGWSSSTGAAAPWPTSPRLTSTTPP